MSREQNMAMMLSALKKAGLNDNQARILAAEIGRENSYKDSILWGYHTDPKNKKLNIGVISWQDDRAKGVERALSNAGLLQGGKIVKGQESLDVMARYIVDEIRNNPSYASTKKLFLDNPNVDYHTGTKVLGRNYIRWAYDNPKYASGHKNRDYYYKALGGITPAEPSNTLVVQQPVVQQPTIQQPMVDLTQSFIPLPVMQTQPPPMQTDPLAGATNVLGVNTDLLGLVNGLATKDLFGGF